MQPTLRVTICRGAFRRLLQTAYLMTFDENAERIRYEESEFSLSDRIDALTKFAPLYGVPESVLSTAVSQIQNRMSEIEEKKQSRFIAELHAFDLARARQV